MVYVRDLAHITELAMQLMFYASAVFFPIEMIPERFRFIVQYNPIAIYIQSVREALTYQNIVNFKFVIGSLIASILLILIGNIYFKHSVKRVAENF